MTVFLQRGCALAVGILVTAGHITGQPTESAASLASVGKVDAAIAVLKASGTNTAENHSLLCSLYASVEQRDAAITECEAAARLAPNNSMYALFLARAYGDKAGHSGTLTGMRMVGRIRGNFERAVQLDPQNVEALSDLGQFYIDAPGVVGGGVDKARPLVARLQPLSPARADRLAGMIAVKDKDTAKADAAFQAEIAAGATPESYVDMAHFLRDQKRWDAAAQAAKAAMEHDPKHGPDTLDAAVLLIEMKRDLPLAQKSLRSYLAAPQQGTAGYARAHTLLAKTYEETGDKPAAQKEYAAALQLAHDYEPARKGAGQ